MPSDRWVVPPAIAAGVFATAAIHPPVYAPSRALTVTAAGEVRPNRPMLLAVSVVGRDNAPAHAPASVTVTLTDATRHLHTNARWNTSPAHRTAPGVVSVQGADPWQLVVSADGLTAHVPVPALSLSVSTRAVPRDDRLDVAVEGGALVPEIQGTVWVYAHGATAIRLESDDDALTVTPATAPVDGCGVAVFHALLRGMDAPVHLVAVGTGVEGRLRLPVDPGGLGVRSDRQGVHVEAFAGPSDVMLAGGDAQGPTWWTLTSMTPHDGAGVLDLALSPTIAWVTASLDPAFTAARSVWRRPFNAASCTPATRDAAWQRRLAAPPPVAPVRVLLDGNRRLEALAAIAQSRARRIAVGLLAVCLAMEIALVVYAGFAAIPNALADLEDNPRARWGKVAAAVAVILVLGFVLGLRVVMERAGE